MTETPYRMAVLQGEAGADPLALLEDAARRAAAAGARLLVGAELMAQGYDLEDRLDAVAEPADGPFATAVAALARAHDLAIITGFAERAGDALYNAALVVDRHGTRLAVHRKRVLPPGYESRHFSTGEAMTLVELDGFPVGVLICYEVEFPEAVRQLALAGAQLVAVPTALGERWRVVARRVVPARAFENTVFVAYANFAGADRLGRYLGQSCIVGPDGEDLARAGGSPELIIADLDPGRLPDLRNRLPFLKDCRGFR